MFYDQARIFIKSGNGGDGMISFRREKFVPLGGPDGGDGGRGGSIIFQVNPSLNSLAHFHKQVHFTAEDGKHGGRKQQTGASGPDMILPVPAGTIIRDGDSKEILADLTTPESQMVLLAGGRGGKGNIHYASSVHQAPRLAERGEPGRERWLLLELKLIADVGIVGIPNAGKSTLLSVISAARPKIGDYPFTTLSPTLGVVTLDGDNSLVFADIPGLIEGASAGIGLGHDFLRHIERTRVLVHLLDGNSPDPLQDWAMINQELALYSRLLAKKPQLVVLNKLDLGDAQAWEPLIGERMKAEGYPFMAISAVTGRNLREMLYRVHNLLAETPPSEPLHQVMPVIRPEEDENHFTIERLPNGWRIHGTRIERIASMTYFEFEATANRFQRILEHSGITQAMEEAGVQAGDTVYIGGEVLEWGE